MPNAIRPPCINVCRISCRVLKTSSAFSGWTRSDVADQLPCDEQQVLKQAGLCRMARDWADVWET
jgi:hypothetical protein